MKTECWKFTYAKQSNVKLNVQSPTFAVRVWVKYRPTVHVSLNLSIQQKTKGCRQTWYSYFFYWKKINRKFSVWNRRLGQLKYDLHWEPVHSHMLLAFVWSSPPFAYHWQTSWHGNKLKFFRGKTYGRRRDPLGLLIVSKRMATQHSRGRW